MKSEPILRTRKDKFEYKEGEEEKGRKTEAKKKRETIVDGTLG